MFIALATFAVASCAPEPKQTSDGPLTWADLTARPAPVADRTVRYGPDPYQVADLWLPATRAGVPRLRPVVLMVHGGCWTTSIADRTLMNYAAGDLRSRGIAVWNIDYRGVDRPGGAVNGIFADVAAAADALRGQAEAYRLDLSRVVAVGHSAGGHLALWLAARPRISGATLPRTADPLPISHVVSLGGLPDLEQAAAQKQGCGPDPVDDLVRTAKLTGTTPRALYADKSIPLLAPIGVPQTLVNGNADNIIPVRFATDYATEMRRAGDRVDVRIVPGQGHVELVAPGTRAWAVAVAEIQSALSTSEAGARS